MESSSIPQDADHECSIVQLKPYLYQVGGHNCMLEYDECTVCKPLNEQERMVYENLPPVLKDFLPQFHGVVTIRFERKGDRILCYALPLKCSYCIDENHVDTTLKKSERCQNRNDNLVKIESIKSVQKDRLLRTWNKHVNNGLGKFILLENISKDFRYPCSIDLKMGTRGSGDQPVSNEKYERHRQRVNRSTSAKLGVRFCGMQVFNSVLKDFIYTDKYKGRTIDETGLVSCLREFIYNGESYRADLIAPIVTKLKLLLHLIENIDSYRFYCSSLLIIYDGCADGSLANVEIRMIDFAQSRVKNDISNHHKGPDKGYILGVRSLIKIFSTFVNDIDS